MNSAPPASRATPSPASQIQVDATLLSFEAVWKAGRRPRLEDYLGDAQGPDGERLLWRLLSQELAYRRQAGEHPLPEDYLSRFPTQPSVILWTFEREVISSESRDTPAPPVSLAETLAPAAAPVRLVGEYELGEKLGGGGMGVVYRARHRRLGKSVALKLLPGGTSEEPDRVGRFLREMQAIGALKHPNIVEAYDAGEQNGTVYLAMELIEGIDLAQMVEQRGPLPVIEACELARQTALGLHYLNEHGLVHRDLKPANLMRTPDGTVKILDLGLARWRAAEAGAQALTVSGLSMGTPDFLAPEQVRDAAAVEGSADLYGLGGTLFYLLTGKAPFAHRLSAYDKMNAHVSEPPPDLRIQRPEVPPALADLVQQLLAKKPEDRPATAADVAAALAPFAAPGPLVPSPSRETTAPQANDPRQRLAIWAALFLVVALLGVAAWNGRNRFVQPSAVSPAENSTGSSKESIPLAQPLTAKIRVKCFSSDGFNLQFIGEVGETTYRARLNDRVELEAELSEPAYAYVIAFNPREKPGDLEQLVPGSEADRQPEKRDRLAPDKSLKLDDGEGLQVFAVVASRQPLPAYTQWRASRPPLKWKRIPATSGVVRQSDGDQLRSLFDPGAQRATEVENDRGAVQELARALKRLPGIDAVSVIGFAVDRPE